MRTTNAMILPDLWLSRLSALNSANSTRLEIFSRLDSRRTRRQIFRRNDVFNVTLINISVCNSPTEVLRILWERGQKRIPQNCISLRQTRASISLPTSASRYESQVIRSTFAATSAPSWINNVESPGGKNYTHDSFDSRSHKGFFVNETTSVRWSTLVAVDSIRYVKCFPITIVSFRGLESSWQLHAIVPRDISNLHLYGAKSSFFFLF